MEPNKLCSYHVCYSYVARMVLIESIDVKRISRLVQLYPEKEV